MQDEYNILIEKFLSNNLSNEEQITFNSLIKNDKEFKSELDLYKSLESHLETKNKYSNQIDAIKLNISNSHKKRTTKLKSKQFLLIFLFISLIISGYLLLAKANEMPKNIYASYLDHYPIEIQDKSLNFESQYKLGIDLYNEKRYNDASKVLATLEFKLPNDGQLALALSYFHNEEYTFSNELFEKLITNPIFKDISLWYMALIDINNFNNDAAINKLKTIDPNSQKYKSAQSLLKELKE